MKNPFSDEPFVSPSMNQVRLLTLEGVTLPDAVRGRRSYELLSAAALRERVAERAAELRLDPAAPDLLRRFDACLDAAVFEVRQAAEEVGREIGRFLAYHLLTLKQGLPESQAVRADWTPRHWAWWGQIERVWLGGGLLSGRLGQVLLAEAQAVMAPLFPTFQLQIASQPAHLTLLGAARTLPLTDGQGLAFDFGQTAVKRGVVTVEAGRLAQIDLLPSLPAECGDLFAPATPSRAQARLAFMERVIDQTWREAQTTLIPYLAVSVSSYIWRGHPRGDSGCYGCISLLGDNMTDLLTTRFSQRLGQAVGVRLLHDGQAAGLTRAGDKKTAVLTLGTALGIGFPPAATTGLLSLECVRVASGEIGG